MLKVQLKRDLRRNILRGHPWIYRDALKEIPKQGSASLCQLLGPKGQPLAWALYDPHNPIAVRILSLDRSPPKKATWRQRFDRALGLRNHVRSSATNAFRLFNGEGDLLPGLVCDVYARHAIIQFDGQGPEEFWKKEDVVEWLMEQDFIDQVVDKSRTRAQGPETLTGSLANQNVIIKENEVQFFVDIEKGQKTGFFLDQRDNRHYLRSLARGRSVLNLFSYSGGFSIYAGMGGATQVTSVDISQGALELAQKNWELNDLSKDKHQTEAMDVSDFLASNKELWDIIIVDPPSMASSEKNKPQGFKKYVELFSQAARKVRPGGHLFVSSCSSHISFDDFFEIINQSLSSARRRGQILRVSGQGPDHPFPHICHELRYLKFVHLVLND